MSNTATSPASEQHAVTWNRSNNNKPLMILLAILLSGTASIWLTVDWLSHQPDNQLWRDWVSLTDRVSAIVTPHNQSISEEKPVTQITKQSDQDLIAYPSFSGSNMKVWRQTIDSIEKLNKQVNNQGQEPSYHNRLGILHSQIGDLANAFKQFKQAVALCRAQISQKITQSKLSDLSRLYVELTCAHSNLARIYEFLGDREKVIAELKELNSDIGFYKDHSSQNSAPIVKASYIVTTTPAPVQQGLTAEEAALLAKAEALRQVGNFQQAIEEYQNLIRLNPKLAIAHQRLGLAAINLKDYWLAMSELQTAASLDDKDPDTYNDLGMVYLQLGDSIAARQSFGHAHYLAPQNLSAAMNFADSLSNSGSMAAALQVMKQATSDHPTSPAAHNNLASLYARRGNDKAAAKEFAQTISLNPSLGEAHYGLGVALLNLKCYTEATKQLEIAQQLNPGILDLQNKLDLANRKNNLNTLASAPSLDY